MKVYEVALSLKTRCDGARRQDGVGYNKFDTIKVDRILSMEASPEREYILYKTLKKYRNQLKGMGIDINNIEFDYCNPDKQEKEEQVKEENDVVVEVTEHKIIIKFDYNKDLVNICRDLPSRRYNPTTKNWELPVSKENVEEVKKAFDSYNVLVIKKVEEIKPVAKNIEKENTADVTFEFAKPDKLKKYEQVIKVKFSYNPKFVEAVKSLPIRSYNKNNKEWEVPTFLENELHEAFKDSEVKVIGEKIESIKDTSEFKIVTKTKPYKHQQDALEFGKDYKKFLLADEQGLGKTKVAIDLAVSRKKAGLIDKCLIICGVNSLKHNWVEEIKIHSNEKSRILGSRINTKGNYTDGSVNNRVKELQNIEDRSEFFIITNIETLRNKDFQEALNDKTETVFGMTVIDEIHKAKNPESGKVSQQGKAIHKINSEYKLALTGTPIMNSPIEFYNILKWLEIETRSLWHFRKQYARMGGYGGYQVVGYQNLDELEQLVDKVQLRRKKTEVLDLPPKVRTKEFIEMTSKQKTLYNEVQMSLANEIDKLESMPTNPLSMLTRLRQVTTIPEMLSSKINVNPKFNRIKEIIEERNENDDKVLVFSNWTQVINPLFEQLKAEGYNPAIITGEIKDRQEQVNKFQNDKSCKVIVGTIGAMGTGLTLTAGSTVIFTDKPWNMAEQEQAEDRAHRIGTTKTVNIISLVAKNSIDEKVENIIEEKDKYSKAMVDKKQLMRQLIGLE